jgi:hypothetical protein
MDDQRILFKSMTKYSILKNESFNASRFPDVVKELAAIQLSLETHDSYHKSEIAISFFKDHSIQMHLIPANWQMIKTITSSFRSTSHIESLFDSCRKNKSFLNGFERYIKGELETDFDGMT